MPSENQCVVFGPGCLQWRVGRVEKRASGIASTGQGAAGQIVGDGKIRVDGEQFMIAVRTDVADRQRSAGSDFLFELQRPGFHGGRLQIGLHTTGNDFCVGVRRVRSDAGK